MHDTARSSDLLRTITEGASNFRDLGGLNARDGRQVRGGAVYRSDHLARLTPEGARALPALGLAVLLLGGCTTLAPDAGLGPVAGTVRRHAGTELPALDASDADIARRAQALLASR